MVWSWFYLVTWQGPVCCFSGSVLWCVTKFRWLMEGFSAQVSADSSEGEWRGDSLSLSSLLLVRVCWVREAAGIQTCLDSKCSQGFLMPGEAWLLGGSWVINPPLFPWLNSSSVHQKLNFKLWGRMVPVRAIPLSAQFQRCVLGQLFSLSCTSCKHISSLYLWRA